MKQKILIKEETLMTDNDIFIIKDIIKSIKSNSNSGPFLLPVDYVGLNLYDYLNVVKKPMDLSTVEKNLNYNTYITVLDALDDLQLIWDNCKSYNYEGSDIYDQATTLEKLTEKLVKNYYNVKRKTKNEETNFILNSKHYQM